MRATAEEVNLVIERVKKILLRALRAKIASTAEPIVGGGAGTGLSAKCEEAGGIDLIVIYNSGRYRMAGRGSLAGFMAYGDANEIVMEMARRGAAGGEDTRRCSPASTAPTRSAMDVFLDEVKRGGLLRRPELSRPSA
jgi:predicted TIM-barrel enzyme